MQYTLPVQHAGVGREVAVRKRLGEQGEQEGAQCVLGSGTRTPGGSRGRSMGTQRRQAMYWWEKGRSKAADLARAVELHESAILFRQKGKRGEQGNGGDYGTASGMGTCGQA